MILLSGFTAMRSRMHRKQRSFTKDFHRLLAWRALAGGLSTSMAALLPPRLITTIGRIPNKFLTGLGVCGPERLD